MLPLHSSGHESLPRLHCHTASTWSTRRLPLWDFENFLVEPSMRACWCKVVVLLLAALSNVLAVSFRAALGANVPVGEQCQNKTCLPCKLGPTKGSPGTCCNRTYSCYDDPLFGPLCLPPYHWICNPPQRLYNRTMKSGAP